MLLRLLAVGALGLPLAAGYAAVTLDEHGIAHVRAASERELGFQTVDASTHNARATAPEHFVFDWGPSHRTVVELRPHALRAESIWPGGTSGVLGDPNYAQFLERWLRNETVQLRLP